MAQPSEPIAKNRTEKQKEWLKGIEEHRQTEQVKCRTNKVHELGVFMLMLTQIIGIKITKALKFGFQSSLLLFI